MINVEILRVYIVDQSASVIIIIIIIKRTEHVSSPPDNMIVCIKHTRLFPFHHRTTEKNEEYYNVITIM